MNRRAIRAPSVLLASALVLWAPLVAGEATSRPTPGFNLFSVEQDIEIGRRSAVEAERQLRLLNDRNLERYLKEIVKKLAAQAPGARYPYSIKAVNAAEINAFALPGGPMYVKRGLFEAARSEAELAGVLAHEMSHVALRHRTHQASKAYLGQAGRGILGGLLGKKGGNTTQIVNAIGGLGLNAASSSSAATWSIRPTSSERRSWPKPGTAAQTTRNRLSRAAASASSASAAAAAASNAGRSTPCRSRAGFEELLETLPALRGD